jgi:hypothetical protein
MKSSWDQTRATSVYHFDPTAHDARWDTVTGLGRFAPCWQDELSAIIENSQPATWATRGYKRADTEVPSEDLQAEQYDLERVGVDPGMTITHLNWQIPPVLQQISDLFAMQDTMNRIHVQLPGELWNLHLDKLQKWCPEDPDQVLRVFVQLTDWQPGQFWEYGNYQYRGWHAGDVTTFDWQHVPHSTANAGHHPRVTFQITGVITSQTQEFLKQLKKSTVYHLT